jgi:SAM-dependent methyltransferase
MVTQTPLAQQRAGWGNTPEEAHYWHTIQSPQTLPLFKAAAKQMRLGVGLKVAFFGCGTGLELIEAARLGADEVVGVDLSENFINYGVKAVEAAKLTNVRLIEQSMVEMPLRDGWAHQVYAHLSMMFPSHDDQLNTLREMRRVLRRGGQAGVTFWAEPDKCTMPKMSAGLRANLSLDLGAGPSPHAFAGYTSMEDMAISTGFFPVMRGEQVCEFRYSDLRTMFNGLTSAGPWAAARATLDHDARLTDVLAEVAAPFRQPDGDYVLTNTFQFVILQRTA